MFQDKSSEDIKVNKKKMFVFSRFKPYFITLIFMRWGILLEDMAPFLYESEEEQIEIPQQWVKGLNWEQDAVIEEVIQSHK